MTQPFPASRYHPRLVEAALALNANALHVAEPLLKQHLNEDPFDVAAIRMLAELAGRIGRYKDSESLLRRAIELSPAFTAARANLALVLYRLNRPVEAIEELKQVVAEDPDNPGHANLQAAAFGRIGDFDGAIALYDRVLKDAPNQPRVWMSYGHMLKTVGRQQDGIAAYRRAIDLLPALGEAWWSLANLKTATFDDADIAAMETALARSDLSDEDRFHLDFALGKAFEDRKQAEPAFQHYAAGNALRKTKQVYDADETQRFVDRSIALFSPEFLAAGGGLGWDAPDPIFILGMPRAGSTLDRANPVVATARSKARPNCPTSRRLPGNGATPIIPLALADVHARTSCARSARTISTAPGSSGKTDRPLFIDKLPNNWAHLPRSSI